LVVRVFWWVAGLGVYDFDVLVYGWRGGFGYTMRGSGYIWVAGLVEFCQNKRK